MRRLLIASVLVGACFSPVDQKDCDRDRPCEAGLVCTFENVCAIPIAGPGGSGGSGGFAGGGRAGGSGGGGFAGGGGRAGGAGGGAAGGVAGGGAAGGGSSSVAVGGACTADVQCGPSGIGFCIQEEVGGQPTGFPGGYCTRFCEMVPCPAGAQCVDAETQNGGTVQICLDACGLSSECRAGYVCELMTCLPE